MHLVTKTPEHKQRKSQLKNEDQIRALESLKQARRCEQMIFRIQTKQQETDGESEEQRKRKHGAYRNTNREAAEK